MKSVNIADLKNRLSHYLNEVKAGEEILVRDRNLPIARIIPLSHGEDQESELLTLAAQGKVRLGQGQIDDEYWRLRLPRVEGKTIQEIIDEERSED
ncbi:MAG TPA: type II toxin-antitoxin system prevent-host-death family antitoxin [Blastocatellia bacterium]|nr:type II toxin-antitoxin system prevent-host-death family antitoxin [Blastocatellia bacterium]